MAPSCCIDCGCNVGGANWGGTVKDENEKVDNTHGHDRKSHTDCDLFGNNSHLLDGIVN